MLEALTQSTVAMDEFAAMVEEFGEGCLEGDELASDSGNRKLAACEILEATREAMADGRSRTSPARTEFVNTVMRYGLTHTGTDELSNRLAAALDTCRVSERPGLESALSTIRESHRTADEARATFVEANIPLVIWMATKKSRGALTRSDLVQEGCLGLIRAVEKFDHRRNLKFSTYATWWIRHFMNRALSDQSRTIRLPVHLVEAKHKAARLLQVFSQQHGREPSEWELSERMGLTAEKVRKLFTAPREPISLDAPLGPDSSACVGDVVTDRDVTSPLDGVLDGHLRHRLRSLLDTLSSREAEVLRLRYGIDRPEGLTLEEVGQRFSISRERARQIEVEALAKLRERAAAENLDAHLSC